MEQNNFDIVKNGIAKIFIESVCNGNNIILEYIENELREIDYMNLYESYKIIKNSELLKLICKYVNKYEIPIYYDVTDLKTIEIAFKDFETEFYIKYGFEPL